MKVAWFSHHKEAGGWAQASRRSILALDSVGVDVVPVNVSLTGADNDIPDRIKELEAGSFYDADYCVQNVLPHCMVATDQYKKNIGYFVTENNTIAHTPWCSQLSWMDELWVPNSTNKFRVMRDVGKSEVSVVPYAFDVSDYEKLYDNIELGDAYKFYYIGEMNDRKNLKTMIRCYQAAFDGRKDVLLVLKVNAPGVNREEVKNTVQEMSMEIKKELKMFRSTDDYSPEVVIPGDMPRNGIMAIHNTADCYVSTSHGEGWGMPIYEAFCMGNPVIAGNEGGPRDFLAQHSHMLVNGTLGPCTQSDSAFPFLGTGRELWFNVSESAVMGKMMQYYKERPCYRKEGIDLARQYSYEAVGSIMKEQLLA
jgi:glycosyltransferase involved in cell wall biosynthesis